MEERRRNGDIQLEILSERFNNFADKYDKDEGKAEEWRGRFCTKLDKLNDRLNELPCPARIEQTKGIHTQLKALWILVSATLLGIISEWVKIK